MIGPADPSSRPGAAMLILCALFVIGSLVLSIVPGRFAAMCGLAIPLTICTGPVVGFALLLWSVIRGRGLRFSRVARPTAFTVLMTATLLTLLIYLHIPQRLVFASVRTQFDALVTAAPTSDDGVPLNRRIGLYRVDEFARDPRGGVYFRVYIGPDGIGPDRLSAGFAYQPNRTGTPFGRARYQLHSIGDGWYSFSASDDYR